MPQNTDIATRTVYGLTARNPEALKAALWSDEWIEAGLKAFHARLVDQKRDAVRLYFECIEAVAGKQERAVMAFLATLGLDDPEQARRMVALAQRANGSSADDALQLAEQLVAQRIKADPDYRRRSMQRLYGVLETPYSVGDGLAEGGLTPDTGGVEKTSARADSGALRTNGNGHHNGKGGPQ